MHTPDKTLRDSETQRLRDSEKLSRHVLHMKAWSENPYTTGMSALSIPSSQSATGHTANSMYLLVEVAL